jgi:hypothetical protein
MYLLTNDVTKHDPAIRGYRFLPLLVHAGSSHSNPRVDGKGARLFSLLSQECLSGQGQGERRMNRISRRGGTPLAYPGIAVLPSERRLACAAKLWLHCYPTVLIDADVSQGTTTPCEQTPQWPPRCRYLEKVTLQERPPTRSPVPFEPTNRPATR